MCLLDLLWKLKSVSCGAKDGGKSGQNELGAESDEGRSTSGAVTSTSVTVASNNNNYVEELNVNDVLPPVDYTDDDEIDDEEICRVVFDEPSPAQATDDDAQPALDTDSGSRLNIDVSVASGRDKCRSSSKRAQKQASCLDIAEKLQNGKKKKNREKPADSAAEPVEQDQIEINGDSGCVTTTRSCPKQTSNASLIITRFGWSYNYDNIFVSTSKVFCNIVDNDLQLSPAHVFTRSLPLSF